MTDLADRVQPEAQRLAEPTQHQESCPTDAKRNLIVRALINISDLDSERAAKLERQKAQEQLPDNRDRLTRISQWFITEFKSGKKSLYDEIEDIRKNGLLLPKEPQSEIPEDRS